jgi:hypothetical protein
MKIKREPKTFPLFPFSNDSKQRTLKKQRQLSMRLKIVQMTVINFETMNRKVITFDYNSSEGKASVLLVGVNGTNPNNPLAAANMTNVNHPIAAGIRLVPLSTLTIAAGLRTFTTSEQLIFATDSFPFAAGLQVKPRSALAIVAGSHASTTSKQLIFATDSYPSAACLQVKPQSGLAIVAGSCMSTASKQSIFAMDSDPFAVGLQVRQRSTLAAIIAGLHTSMSTMYKMLLFATEGDNGRSTFAG